MRLVIARCSVDYIGRLEAHLPMADRLLMVKADGSVSIHADDRAYKPLNWMTPPCTLTETTHEESETGESIPLWIVENKKGEQLRITIEALHSDMYYDLGEDPGLQKDGVEAHLQELLAEHIETLGDGYSLVRREYPTPIGPVEIKRRGGIDGVEQLSRYLELLNRDDLLAPVAGVFAAQHIKPQARTLAEDRGIRCVTLDYDSLRGIESTELRLF
ncbi:endonuclease NucS [Corynebacterium diphtheriae]|uniref:endonuclease NucS n=1 Tax=Corynebacterium diphtheriae TaxID=1717 RepID=UPI00272A8846|nr:endonuclease NucS [Corynebacterium diphtheriae]WLF43697.1 endonuclease NucS [Corynebacterium diphtheriae]